MSKMQILEEGPVLSSFFQSVVDVLIHKTFKAAETRGLKNISVSGGLAASQKLRSAFEEEAAQVLGIDYNSWTQVGLFPIAHTIGTDFKKAPRLDTRGLVSFDTFGNN